MGRVTYGCLPGAKSDVPHHEAEYSRFRVSTTWQKGAISKSVFLPRINEDSAQQASSCIFHSHEPHPLPGGDPYPDAQELLIAAFNACMTATFFQEATKAGLKLSQFSIATSGRLARSVTALHTMCSSDEAIHYEITLRGKGSVTQFEAVHQAVINHSINRWALSNCWLIEGDLIVLPGNINR